MADGAVRTRLGLSWLLVPAVVVGVLTGSLSSAAAPRSAPDLQARIDSLRLAGDVAGALDATRDLRRLLERTRARTFAIEDARRLEATLARVAAMPAAERTRFVAADSLREVCARAEIDDQAAVGLAAAEQDLAIRRALLGEDDVETVQALARTAVMQDLSGDAVRAEACYRQALAGFERVVGERHPLTATCLTNLASLYRLGGRFASSEELFARAIAISRETMDSEDITLAENIENYGGLKREVGDYGAAADLFREALAIYERAGTRGEIARGLNNVALATYDRGAPGDLAAADSLWQRSLALREQEYGPRHIRLASVLDALGRVCSRREEHARAETYLRRSLAIREASLPAQHPSIAIVCGQLGGAMQAAGRMAEAEKYFQRSLAILETAFGSDDYRVGRAKEALANLAFQRDDLRAAESLLLSAAESYDRNRLAVQAGQTRAAFLETPYAKLALMRLLSGRPAEAWVAAEQHLARGLGDLLLGAQEAGGVPSLAAIQSTLDDDEAIIGWLEPYAVESKVEPDGYDAWAYCLRCTGPVHWRRLQCSSSPTPREAVVDACRSVGTPPDGRAAAESANAARLARERFAPLLPDLAGVTRLVVISSGTLHGLPLEYLPLEDGQQVIDRFDVSYTPSARLHAHLRRLQRGGDHGGRRPGLVVADPPFNAEQALAMRNDPDTGCGSSWSLPFWSPPSGPHDSITDEIEAQLAVLRSAVAGDAAALARLSRVACSRREATACAGRLPAGTVCLVGEEASETRLAAMAAAGRLDDFGVLHLATHALVDVDQPARSALVLAQVPAPTADDGLLTAAEVGAWHLSCDLVCLSACSTALGRREADEGIIGLGWAFLGAGARAALVSLWRVDDESTALLMDRFYDLWQGQGLPKAAALRQAKLALRARSDGRADPFYWAGFILVGDPR